MMASWKQHVISLIALALVVCSCNGQSFSIRWCTISDSEQNKCEDMVSQVNFVLKSNMSCVQRTSHSDCMKTISENEADAVTLDGGDIYIAGKDYDMKPVMAEDYGTGDVSYWAVAVAYKSTDISIDTLEGKKSCHTGIGKTSGWNVPIGLLLEKEYITVDKECNVPKAVGEFFDQSCVPGAKDPAYDPNGDNPDNLCNLCIGEEDSQCARNSQEPYYDYSGAFRCLVEGAGDVAFVKHSTLASYTDENAPPEWSVNASSSDFKLLCPNGSTNPDNSFMFCNLASVPSHAVMIGGDRDDAYFVLVESLLLGAQALYGDDDNNNGFKMFDSADYGGSDLLFKDSTRELLQVGEKDTWEEFLGDDYMEALKAVNCDNAAGTFHGSLVVMMLAVFMVFGLK